MLGGDRLQRDAILSEKQAIFNDPPPGESTPLVQMEGLALEAKGTGGERIISAIHPHDDKGILEWSWKESMFCEDAGDSHLTSSLVVCTLFPCIFVAFSVTLVGKIVHDFYEQGLPLTPLETAWERKVRVQGVLTTTGLMVFIIAASLVILLRRYMQLKNEAAFDDMTTVYLRTLITIASSINVIFSNIIFLNAMRSKWQQTVNYYIIGSYAIVLSQIAVGFFDTWILLSGDYSTSDVIFCVLHLSETLYSAIQCVLYQTMWNYYNNVNVALGHERFVHDNPGKATSEGEIIASTNLAMLAFVNWASLLISFRFTSISEYMQRNAAG